MKFSIVIVASSASIRFETGKQVASAFRCLLFSASAVRGALEIVQRESPDVALVHQEFAKVEGCPIQAAISSCCPKTRTVIFNDFGAGIAA